MTTTEAHDEGISDLLTNRMAGVHVESVGFFARSVVRPDTEADATMQRQEAEAALGKLTDGEKAAVIATLREQVADEFADRERQILSFVDAVLSFVCTNFSPAKLYGIRFALNLPSVAGTTQSEAARRLGVERATISVHATSAMRVLGLKPSETMRSLSAVKASRAARLNHCQPSPS